MNEIDRIGIKSKVYSDIIAQINGQNSINQLIDYVIQAYHMNQDQAQEVVTTLLINLYEGYIFKDL